MKCSKCGFINGSSAEFCMKCGAPMESENNDEVEGNVTPVVNNTKKSNLFRTLRSMRKWVRFYRIKPMGLKE